MENTNTRVVIAVEDAVRLGADTLAEIEALTAVDAGESDGANLVLMGDETLQTVLEDPALVLKDALTGAKLYRDYAELQRQKEKRYPYQWMQAQRATIPPAPNFSGPGMRSTNSS